MPLPSPEGTLPAEKPEETVPIEKLAPAIKVLTWNIQYGADEGDQANRWPERKRALKALLVKENSDVLCVQEALKGQIAFLEKLFPTLKRIGVGREDGKEEGEFCALFFDPKRLNLVESGTFWLSDTPDKPGRCWQDRHPRTCAWARFEDPFKKKTFRIFNTHFPLNPLAGEKATKLITKRLREEHPDEPLILAGDFNSGPGSDPWKIFFRAGLRNSEMATEKKFLSRTLHTNGFPLSCVDGIFLSAGWGVAEHHVIDARVDQVYPSDHFGVVAEVYLSNRAELKPAHPEQDPASKFGKLEPLETMELPPATPPDTQGPEKGRERPAAPSGR